MKWYLYFLWPALIGLTACNDDQPLTDLEDLPYGEFLAAFEAEHRARLGSSVADELRALQFVRIDGHGEAESCNSEVVVIPASFRLITSNNERDLYTEQYIFHQLGHCILKRPHVSERFDSYDWTSIMRDEPFLTGAGAGINYQGDRRDYYLEELFRFNEVVATDYIDTDASVPGVGVARTLVARDSCNAPSSGYAVSLPPGSDFDIEVRLPTADRLDRFDLTLIGGGNSNPGYLRLVYDPTTNRLFLNGDSISYQYTYTPDMLQSFFGELRFTLRRRADEIQYYVNSNFMFRTVYKLLEINRLNVFADPLTDCERVSVYSLD